MILQKFKDDYYCKLELSRNTNIITIKSVVHLRSDDSVIDSIKTNIEIQRTNDWIHDSQTQCSLIEWDCQKIIDQIKRSHLCYFAQNGQISDFYPLNQCDNPNIDIYYK